LSSKKRGALEEENGQPVEPISPEVPKIRKTVPGSLNEKPQIEVAAGCSANTQMYMMKDQVGLLAVQLIL